MTRWPGSLADGESLRAALWENVAGGGAPVLLATLPPRAPPPLPQHLVQPSAIQHGCQLVKAGLRRVQQELDSEQVFLKQEEANTRTGRETENERWGRACG